MWDLKKDVEYNIDVKNMQLKEQWIYLYTTKQN